MISPGQQSLKAPAVEPAKKAVLKYPSMDSFYGDLLFSLKYQ